MTDKTDKDAKAARLAEALRVNLKRRKAQARGDVAPAGPRPDPRSVPQATDD